MTNFYSSDLHEGHSNILNLGVGRPFNTLRHMHAEMVRRFNSMVGPDDNLYLLGDIVMGNFEETLPLLEEYNGNKFFIAGNHDKTLDGMSQKWRDRFTPLLVAAGFTILPDNTYAVIDDHDVILSHFPYHEKSEFVDKFKKNRPVDEGLPLIHGHTHSRSVLTPGFPRMFHVGVDAHNYEPVPESEIIDWLNTL